MTLVTEDGTGKADAESYAAVADADTYFTNRANTAWTGATAAKEAALRKATDYMVANYRDRWAGVRTTSAQALDWPRFQVPMRDAPGIGSFYSFYDFNSVPAAVKNACIELALRSLSGDLLADQSQNVLSEKIGAIQTDYDPNSPQGTRYPFIDAMLSPLLAGGRNGGRVVRA